VKILLPFAGADEPGGNPELILDGGAGRSDGGAFSSREWQLEGYYLSAPIHRYRVFVHDTVTYGSFDEGPGRDHRLGAGLEDRAPDWTQLWVLT